MIHYQIPASVDIYVHRSGRTARGDADGLAIALVAPKEAPRYAALQQVIRDSLQVSERAQSMLSWPEVFHMPAGTLQRVRMLGVDNTRPHQHMHKSISYAPHGSVILAPLGPGSWLPWEMSAEMPSTSTQ